MKVHLINKHPLVQMSRSSNKVSLKYQGHIFHIIWRALVFDKHIWFRRNNHRRCEWNRLHPVATTSIKPRIEIRIAGKLNLRIPERYYVDMTLLSCVNRLIDMPTLGSSNAAANEDMMSKILTNGNTIF